jgi:hypothetical protein
MTMSLEACPECHKEVDRAAATCPHCGAPRKKHLIRMATVVQLVILAVALWFFTIPLVKKEPLFREIASALPPSVPEKAASKRGGRSKKAARRELECAAPGVQQVLVQLWRDEVAQVLSRQTGYSLESAQHMAGQMKVSVAAVQTQFENPAEGVLQCAALVTISEGSGFRPSATEVTYSAEFADGGRAYIVRLVYARMPPL